MPPAYAPPSPVQAILNQRDRSFYTTVASRDDFHPRAPSLSGSHSPFKRKTDTHSQHCVCLRCNPAQDKAVRSLEGQWEEG